NAIARAPPARNAAQVASPEVPSPNTATFLPASVVTGITSPLRLRTARKTRRKRLPPPLWGRGGERGPRSRAAPYPPPDPRAPRADRPPPHGGRGLEQADRPYSNRSHALGHHPRFRVARPARA